MKTNLQKAVIAVLDRYLTLDFEPDNKLQAIQMRMRLGKRGTGQLQQITYISKIEQLKSKQDLLYIETEYMFENLLLIALDRVLKIDEQKHDNP